MSNEQEIQVGDLHAEDIVKPQFNEEPEVAEAPEAEGDGIQAEIHIQVMEDGRLNLVTPEGRPELEPRYVEGVVRQVYEELHEMRLAQNALEIIKQRLG